MKEIRKVELEFKAVDNEEQELRIQGYAARVNQPETYSLHFNVNLANQNNSLKLTTDENGLYMDAILQKDITDHVNIYNAIKSGLIDKQSFAFVVDEDSYDYDTDTRTITKIGKVFDVSVVDQPFYNSTDVAVARKEESNEFTEKRNQLRKEHEEELRKQSLEELKNKVIAKLG